MSKCVMAYHKVICVQLRDDERTERFVIFSSDSPLSDWTRNREIPKNARCSNLLDESEMRVELRKMGLEDEEIESDLQKARAFKTTTTSDTLWAGWVRSFGSTTS